MLFDLLDQMADRINALDQDRDWPAYADQLRATNPQMLQSLMGDDSDERIGWAAERVARAHLGLIKDIPWYVHALIQAADAVQISGPISARHWMVGIIGRQRDPSGIDDRRMYLRAESWSTF